MIKDLKKTSFGYNLVNNVKKPTVSKAKISNKKIEKHFVSTLEAKHDVLTKLRGYFKFNKSLSRTTEQFDKEKHLRMMRKFFLSREDGYFIKEFFEIFYKSSTLTEKLESELFQEEINRHLSSQIESNLQLFDFEAPIEN